MKRLLLLFIALSLFTINGCAQNTTQTAKATPVVAEEPKARPVLTAKDLKIQPKSAPRKKYNDLSLRAVRQSQSAIQRGQSNGSGTTQNGSAYLRKNPM